MGDLARKVGTKLMVSNEVWTEDALAREFETSPAEIRKAVSEQDGTIVVDSDDPRSYRFELRSKRTVKKFRENGLG
jgi:hypothetical protein